MSKLKTIPILCALCACSVIVQAQVNYLCVHKKDATARSFKLSGLRKITFTADNMVVQPAVDGASLFAFDTVSKLTFERSETRLAPPTVGSPLSIRYDSPSGNVVIRSDKPLGRIEVYSVQGVLVRSVHTSSETVEIALSGLPAGMYIVKTVETVAKILRK
jgi:hypothetical protein